MFHEIPDLLSASQLDELQRIAASAPFADGRITNPHNKAKQNLQLHDEASYEQSSQLLLTAMQDHEDFQNFAFPAEIAPPLLTRYEPGMRYGAHSDAAYIPLPGRLIRSDLSCTIFLSDPESYEGGDLIVHLGTKKVAFKGTPGSCLLYPSDTLHEVAPVTRGARLVAISFIQSRVADPFRREMLYEINEIAALEGLTMQADNRTRLSLFRERLLRHWGDKPEAGAGSGNRTRAFSMGS